MSDRHLTMAYADPPYIGQAKKHYEGHPDYAGEVDHGALVERLVRDYPDGWALSLSSPSTHIVLDHCRDHGLDLMAGDIRLCAWFKPFAAFKANVRVAYAWEPIIIKPAERLDGAMPTRDFIESLALFDLDLAVREPITMRRGLAGAKPERVCHWLFGAMGLRRTDELHDLFPGSGAVARAWETWTMQLEVAA
jgi:hypothetical protein